MTTPQTMLDLANEFDGEAKANRAMGDAEEAKKCEMAAAALRAYGYLSDLKFANEQNIRVAREWKARAEKAEADIWNSAYEYFKAEAARTAVVSRPQHSPTENKG
jgi:hypothetical protein